MLNSTEEADDVAAWLRTKYPAEFGGDRTQVIHTKNNGEIKETDLEEARKAVREVDSDDSPINAIVSVLMLREGWDVKKRDRSGGLASVHCKGQYFARTKRLDAACG
jgi:type III restriction enzyme